MVHKKCCFSMPLEKRFSGVFSLKRHVLGLFSWLGVFQLFHVGEMCLVLVTAYIGRRAFFTIFGGKL